MLKLVIKLVLKLAGAVFLCAHVALLSGLIFEEYVMPIESRYLGTMSVMLLALVNVIAIVTCIYFMTKWADEFSLKANRIKRGR